ncbi:MAG TPA: CotH kinase family protein [Eubacteriales bacterium]|nr:CotH kinase family protein [Eubacteriales bacterium]
MLCEVTTTTRAKLNEIIAERNASQKRFLTFLYETYDLPFYEKDNCSLFCSALAESITVRSNINCETALLREGSTLTIVAWNENSYRLYTIELTTLPILCMETVGKTESETVGEEYCGGFLTVFDSNAGSVEHLYANFKVHGASSLLFYPKNSYTIKLLNRKTGDELIQSLLGISESTKFALNSLYEDDSKIRDIVSLTLWQKIEADSTDNVANAAIEITPCEVFLNGEYEGLFGFQEVVGRSSVAADTADENAIFKVLSYDIPALETFDPGLDSWGDIELVYNSLETPWENLCETIRLTYYGTDEAFANEIGSYLDLDNCIDYYLYVSFLHAADNIWKNFIFLQSAETGEDAKLKILPWDTDQTFGAIWVTETERKVEYDISCATGDLASTMPWLLGRLWSCNVNGFNEKAAERWFALRSSALDEQFLVQYANDVFDEITQSGARARDAARWPDSAVCEDNSFIDSFIRLRLAYLDEFFAGYLQKGGND